MSTETDPKILDLLKAHFESAQAGQHGPMFAEVTAYDHTTQAADVRPLVRLPVDGVFVDAPIIHKVRVRWLGGGGFAATFPLAVGDVGELTPLAADFSNWIASGTKNQDAPTEGRYQLRSCVFKPVYRPFNSPLGALAVHATFPVISGDPLLLGDSTADKLVALADLVRDELDGIKADLDLLSNHSHGGVEPGTGVTGTGPPLSYSPSTPAATKVKAK
jgi:hypothetical protein